MAAWKKGFWHEKGLMHSILQKYQNNFKKIDFSIQNEHLHVLIVLLKFPFVKYLLFSKQMFNGSADEMVP